ncbi:hypothetical protein F0562_008588 [Nyssa sinensis]|uniref:Uncharacterized protein n=1 Tax=Nyssa sinensis TaxID=561372 RepID=A0A5J5A8E8_9ASTE|nr:hypothetical protein F0562_008588 [Nyssa sinensis]
MGRGRAPCCDKSKVKKGPWSPAEDLRLITFIQKHGHGNWRALPKQAGLSRCGKSCRLRWINYLRPDVRRGNFSPEEEETIIKLHQSLGNKWSKIASHLPGRTDNEIKNVWNTHLKKKKSLMKDANAHGVETWMTSSSSSSSSFNGLGDQEGQGSVAVRTDELCHKVVLEKKQDPPTENELKEASSSSSSNSSAISNFSNFDTQVNISSPREEMDSLFDFRGPCEVLHNATYGVKNQDVRMSDEVVEIPLESDADFWDLLDNLESFQPQELEVEASQSSNIGEECERES